MAGSTPCLHDLYLLEPGPIISMWLHRALKSPHTALQASFHTHTAAACSSCCSFSQPQHQLQRSGTHAALSFRVFCPAEYLGGAITCDAYHMTDPRADGLGVSTCIDLALKDSRIERDQVCVCVQGPTTVSLFVLPCGSLLLLACSACAVVCLTLDAKHSKWCFDCPAFVSDLWPCEPILPVSCSLLPCSLCFACLTQPLMAGSWAC